MEKDSSWGKKIHIHTQIQKGKGPLAEGKTKLSSARSRGRGVRLRLGRNAAAAARTLSRRPARHQMHVNGRRSTKNVSLFYCCKERQHVRFKKIYRC